MKNPHTTTKRVAWTHPRETSRPRRSPATRCPLRRTAERAHYMCGPRTFARSRPRSGEEAQVTLPIQAPNAGSKKWAVPGSNGRPPACKAGASAAVCCGLSLRTLGERWGAHICCALLRFAASRALPYQDPALAHVANGFAQVQDAYRPNRRRALVRPRRFGDPRSTGCPAMDSQSVKDSQQPSRSVWPEGGQDDLHTKSAERVVRGSGSRLGASSRTTWLSLRCVHTSRPGRPAQLRFRSL
jgi:hypothetical protein